MSSTFADPSPTPSSGGANRTQPRITPRGRLHTLMGIQILGIGAYVPDEVVSNEDLAELGYDADWIVQRTGIHERRRAAADEATSDMAYEAALQCLEQAGVEASEVDLIILATMTPDHPMPSSACQLQQKLGCQAPAMDVNAACSGFMYAMVTGMQYIKSGCSQRALIVGADLMSRVLNPEDKKTFPLFGDGAGAVLLGAGENDQGMLSYLLGADGAGADLLCMPAGGSREPVSAAVLAANRQYMYMNGRPVFKWAVRLVADSILDVLEDAQILPNDLQLVVLHQANARIIDSAINDLGIDREKVVLNLDRYGNTSAASIPLALQEVYEQGRISRGDHVLLCGFGAGLTWGTAVLKW